MRRRRDTPGVDVLHLFGIREKVGELTGEERELFRGQRESREFGQMPQVVGPECGRHDTILQD
jgi:hypothetical protein